MRTILSLVLAFVAADTRDLGAGEPLASVSSTRPDSSSDDAPLSASVPSAIPDVVDRAGNWGGKERFEAIFAPLRTDAATLSPDGKYLAYAIYEAGRLGIVVVAVDAPEKALARVLVNDDTRAQLKFFNRPREMTEDPPPRIVWMQMISSTRVVALTNWGNGPALVAFDVEGKNARILATMRTVATLDGFEVAGVGKLPATLVVRTKRPKHRGFQSGMVPEDDYLRLDTITGKFTSIDEAQAKQESRQWQQEQKSSQGLWKEVAAELADVLPNRRITLLQNDDAGRRYLARVEGFAEAGAFFVYDRPRRVALEMARRQPQLDANHAHPATEFEFVAADGERVTGELVMPRRPRVFPVPVVVIMPAKVNQRLNHSFSRDALAFAEMGFASVQFDSLIRVTGPRQLARDREKWLVDEVARLIDGLGGLHPVSKKRIVLYGEGNAAYLALRALQILPERFRGAVAMLPGIGYERWVEPDSWPTTVAKRGGAAGIVRPFLAFEYRGRERHGLDDTFVFELAAAVKKNGVPAEAKEAVFDLKQPFAKMARAAAFQEIERFLLATVFEYEVRVGEAQVVPSP